MDGRSRDGNLRRFGSVALGLCAVSCTVDEGDVDDQTVDEALAEAVATTRYASVCAVGGRLFGADGPTVVGCTGTLIAPNIVLTAGHCAPPDDIKPIFWPSADGGVNCDAVVDDSSINWHGGTFVSGGYVEHRHDDPSYDNHDIAVFVLDEPILDVRPAKLPRRGFLDHLFDSPGAASPKLTMVGYGTTTLDWTYPDVLFPTPGGVGTRRKTTARVAGLNEFYLFSDPAPGQGSFADSGGPVFLAGSNILLGHNTDLSDVPMWQYRADTAGVLDFLHQFVTSCHGQELGAGSHHHW